MDVSKVAQPSDSWLPGLPDAKIWHLEDDHVLLAVESSSGKIMQSVLRMPPSLEDKASFLAADLLQVGLSYEARITRDEIPRVVGRLKNPFFDFERVLSLPPSWHDVHAFEPKAHLDTYLLIPIYECEYIGNELGVFSADVVRQILDIAAELTRDPKPRLRFRFCQAGEQPPQELNDATHNDLKDAVERLQQSEGTFVQVQNYLDDKARLSFIDNQFLIELESREFRASRVDGWLSNFLVHGVKKPKPVSWEILFRSKESSEFFEPLSTDIEPIVSRLQLPNNGLVEMYHSNGDYMRAQLMETGGYSVEYGEGDDFFLSVNHIDTASLIEILESFRVRDGRWRDLQNWQIQ